MHLLIRAKKEIQLMSRGYMVIDYVMLNTILK